MNTKPKLHLWDKIEKVLTRYHYIDESGVWDIKRLKDEFKIGHWRNWRDFGPVSAKLLMVRLGIEELDDSVMKLPWKCQDFLRYADFIKPDGCVDMEKLRNMLTTDSNRPMKYRGFGQKNLNALYQFAGISCTIKKPAICPCCQRPL